MAYTESARNTLNVPTADSVPAVQQENEPGLVDGTGLIQPADVPVVANEPQVAAEDRGVPPPPPVVEAPAPVADPAPVVADPAPVAEPAVVEAPPAPAV